LTNNQDELRTVIDELEPEGNFTALNDGALEAVSMLGDLPSGRKAVIILTDRVDNISSTSLEEVISQAQQANVPLYPIGFGAKVRADVLDQVARSTGGRAAILSSPDELAAELQTLAVLLRQGYQVTFQSGVKADNAGHDLSIAVVQQGQAGRPAEGQFVAIPGQVSVTLPGFSDGQRVEGTVTLNAQITAPASVASVEYLLDGQSLTTVGEPPYGFEWDSTTVAPGPHTLGVKVVDQAGNEGQMDVSLEVSSPALIITVSTLRDEIPVGDEVDIQAGVNPQSEVANVDFLVDGVLLGSDESPPYSFSFDSSAYQPGEGVITVRATDKLGRETEAELAIQFLPSAELTFWQRLTQGAWVQYLLTGLKWGLVALLIIAVLVIGLRLLTRVQKPRPQTHRLQVANRGNASSRYELKAEEPQGALRFQFALYGANLPQRPVPQVNWVAPKAAPGIYQTTGATVAAPGPSGAAPPPAEKKGRGAAGEMMGKAQAKGDQARGCVWTIAEMLDTLAYLLPGSAGTSVSRLSQRLTRSQAVVERTPRTPTQMARSAKYLGGQVSELAPSGARGQVPARAAASAQPGDTGVATAGAGAGAVQPGVGVPAPATDQWEEEALAANGRQVPVSLWAETPFVEPGEALTIDLSITPIEKPKRTQAFSFKLLSRAIEQADAPLVEEEGRVEITGFSWLHRLFSYLIFVTIAVTAILIVLFLVLNLEAIRLYLQHVIAGIF
jgi:hypothetical protein